MSTITGRDSLRTPSLTVQFHCTLASYVLQSCDGKNVFPTHFYSPFESPQIPKEKGHISCPFIFWRRGRDSNPRVVSHKLISSQPRYDRFDTSAYIKILSCIRFWGIIYGSTPRYVRFAVIRIKSAHPRDT